MTFDKPKSPGAEGRDFRQVVIHLDGWAEVFRKELKLRIPAVPIRITRVRSD